jgi:hypothetical protein
MRVWAVFFLAAGLTDGVQSKLEVGWRFQLAADPARQYEPETGDASGPGPRPVAITIFYPAADGSGSFTTLEELARLGAYDRFREPPPAAFDAAATALKDVRRESIAQATHSIRDAAPRPGRYPLVLFAHATPLGMVAMSETLAAHGFVVAGVMSRGAERGAYRLSVADVQAMGEDLRVALHEVGNLPFVDASRVGVVGMSNGAFGAVALANTTRVQAIVSLDGTLGERAAARVLPELQSASAPASQPPVLHLYAPDNSYLDFSELRKRPGECVAVRVPEVGHSDFLTFALLAREGPPSPGRTRVAEKFTSILRLTREFLTTYLTTPPPGPLRLTDIDKTLGLTAAACRDR